MKWSGQSPQLRTSCLFDLPLNNTEKQMELNIVMSIADDTEFDNKQT